MNAMKTAEKTETAVRAALHALHKQNACCYISLQRTEGNLYLKIFCHIYVICFFVISEDNLSYICTTSSA